MQPRNTRIAAVAACALLSALGAGCATKGFVRNEVKSLETKMEPTTATARDAQTQARDAQVLAQDVDTRARRVERETQLARDLALGNVKREEVRRVTVTFGFDSVQIPEELQSELEGVAADLQAHPNYMALVSGYTDATGDEEYNFSLAQRRAVAVQRFLAVRLGPEFVRLAVIGFGEALPVADNETSEGRAQNRRTEVVLVQPAPATPGGAETPTAAR